LAKGGAGSLLLLQRRKRLSEPQHRIGRLGRLVILGRHGEEGLGGIAILLALEQAFAEPVLGIADHRIVREFLPEIAHGLLGQRIVPALHVADAEIVFVARRVGWRCGREPTGAGWVERSLRHIALLIGRCACGVREVQRFARSAAAGSADRSIGRDQQLAAAQRTRRPRRVRILAWIEGVAATRDAAPCWWRFLDNRRGRGGLGLAVTALLIVALLAIAALLVVTRLRLRLRGVAALGLIGPLRLLAISALGGGYSGDPGLGRRLTGRRRCGSLQRPQLLLELAVAVLQLLVLAGQLPELILQSLDPDRGILVI